MCRAETGGDRREDGRDAAAHDAHDADTNMGKAHTDQRVRDETLTVLAGEATRSGGAALSMKVDGKRGGCGIGLKAGAGG